MEVLLGSDTLQLRSENDAYYLLCAWLFQNTRFDKKKKQKDKEEEEEEEREQEDDEEEKAVAAEEEGGEEEESADDDNEEEDEEEEKYKDQAILKQLLPQLRFHHMSHGFLCMVVSACPFARACDALPYIVSCGHALRAMSRALANRTDANGSKVDRSTGDMKCIFRNEIDLAERLRIVMKHCEVRTIKKKIRLVVHTQVNISVVCFSNHFSFVVLCAQPPQPSL